MKNLFSAYFNARASNRRFQELFSALLKAVKQAEAPQAGLLYADVKKTPQYDSQAEAKLLRAALKADDAAVFSVLLAGLKTPDYFFTRAVSAIHPRGAMIVEKEHILYAAIRSGSKNVALALALNPAVSADRPGGVKMTRGYFAGGGYRPYNVSLAMLARERNMPEVAAVLAARKKLPGPKI